MSKKKNVSNRIGKIYGQIQVLEEVEPILYPNGWIYMRQYRCKCLNCGREVVKRWCNIDRDDAPACGCLQNTNTGHNRKYFPKNNKLLKRWQGMRQRCYNSNADSYDDYGGRGITICDEWLDDYTAFEDWALDNGYDDELSIDRINVNGNYEPTNCRWADQHTQSTNKRNTVYIDYMGEPTLLCDIATDTGISYAALYNRYFKQGLRDEDLTAPITHGNNRPRLYVTDGIDILSIRDMASKYNTTYSAIYNHIQKDDEEYNIRYYNMED